MRKLMEQNQKLLGKSKVLPAAIAQWYNTYLIIKMGRVQVQPLLIASIKSSITILLLSIRKRVSNMKAKWTKPKSCWGRVFNFKLDFGHWQ
jgi:hypothetical protein